MTGDTASSPDRKKAKLDPFADVRDYTAPSTGASAAELAEYKSMSAPAVGPLEFWRQGGPAADYVLHRQAFFVCVCELGPIRAWLLVCRPHGDGNAVASVGWQSRGVGAGALWHASRCSVTMTRVRLSATLVTLNFDYVSCVLRPRLVANVNSSVSSCVEL